VTIEQTWLKLSKSKEYRSAFAKAQFKRLVPFQIRALRKQRGWSQEALAANADLTQGVVSRAEDSDYGNLTVNTILRIADGFDVVFVGKFVPYSEFVRWYDELSEMLPPIPSFEEEFRTRNSVSDLNEAEVREAALAEIKLTMQLAASGNNGLELAQNAHLGAAQTKGNIIFFPAPTNNKKEIVDQAGPQGGGLYEALSGNPRQSATLR
jgi:transcriptional regulator with XRE-family HTH domain